eukprot:2290351-Rhodomonas_salina.1
MCDRSGDGTPPYTPDSSSSSPGPVEKVLIPNSLPNRREEGTSSRGSNANSSPYAEDQRPLRSSSSNLGRPGMFCHLLHCACTLSVHCDARDHLPLLHKPPCFSQVLCRRLGPPIDSNKGIAVTYSTEIEYGGRRGAAAV